MPYVPGDQFFISFTTENVVTEAATDADSIPTAKLRRNGVDDLSVIVTVAHNGTGDYTGSGTIPLTYAAGDDVEMIASATVNGVSGLATFELGELAASLVTSLVGPIFEYIPVLGTPGAVSLKIAQLVGLSTMHADPKSDRGRLYGSLAKSGSTYTLNLYSDYAKGGGSLVLSGSTSSLQSYFALTAQNASGLSGRAWLDSYSSDDSNLVIVPTFAVDADVLKQADQAALFGAYDPTYGFSYFHADAMRKILTSDLPAAVPHLFGKTGLAAFVPQGAGGVLPDLSKIANVDQLREAQAALVKALAAEDSEQSPAMQEIAKAARMRYQEAMQRLAEANVLEVEEKAQEQADEMSVSIGSFRRG